MRRRKTQRGNCGAYVHEDFAIFFRDILHASFLSFLLPRLLTCQLKSKKNTKKREGYFRSGKMEVGLKLRRLLYLLSFPRFPLRAKFVICFRGKIKPFALRMFCGKIIVTYFYSPVK